MNHAPNTTHWQPGDLVIHDADAKRPEMLMRVLYSDGDEYTTKYLSPHTLALSRGTFKNSAKYLHDPARFGIDVTCEFPAVHAEVARLRAENERLTAENKKLNHIVNAPRNRAAGWNPNSLKGRIQAEACETFHARHFREPWFASVGIGTEGSEYVLIVGVREDQDWQRAPSRWGGYRVVTVDERKLAQPATPLGGSEGSGEASKCVT